MSACTLHIAWIIYVCKANANAALCECVHTGPLEISLPSSLPILVSGHFFLGSSIGWAWGQSPEAGKWRCVRVCLFCCLFGNPSLRWGDEGLHRVQLLGVVPPSQPPPPQQHGGSGFLPLAEPEVSSLSYPASHRLLLHKVTPPTHNLITGIPKSSRTVWRSCQRWWTGWKCRWTSPNLTRTKWSLTTCTW